MHELSIAQALVRLADRHVGPDDAVVRLHVRAGPFQAIERGAMDWAWTAAAEGTRYEKSALDLELSPWRCRCASCGEQHEIDPFESCPACGQTTLHPVGGDELLLVSVDIERPEEVAAPTESPREESPR